VSILTANWVSVPVAEKVAQEFPPERVRLGVRLAREISARAKHSSSPIRNLAALTLRVIRDPEKYALMEDACAPLSASQGQGQAAPQARLL